MSNEDGPPGAGAWRRDASGKWVRLDTMTGEELPAPEPMISQETSDKLEDAIGDALALREQARIDAEKETLRQDLTSELKVGHPTARLAEFLGAIAEGTTPEQPAPAAPTKPTPTLEQALKEALAKNDGRNP